MDTAIFLAFAGAYVALLLWGVALIVRRRRVVVSDLAILVVLGLVYDNSVIGLGTFIGEGPVLEGLNGARYWLHAFLTPLLVLVAWDVLRRARVHWAKTVWAAGGGRSSSRSRSSCSRSSWAPLPRSSWPSASTAR